MNKLTTSTAIPTRAVKLEALSNITASSFETAARSLKVEPIIAPVHSDGEIEVAIVTLGREPRGGLVVLPDTFMYAHRASIILARPETTYRRFITYLRLPETAVCFLTESTT
jgi:hypothetical protein